MKKENMIVNSCGCMTHLQKSGIVLHGKKVPAFLLQIHLVCTCVSCDGMLFYGQSMGRKSNSGAVCRLKLQ